MEKDFIEVASNRMSEVYIPSTVVNNILMTEEKPLNCLQRKEEEESTNALNIQIGGNHYKQFEIEPIEFCQKNKLDVCQSNVIKYVCRHSFKDGIKDLEKAKHCIDLLIQMEYKDVKRKRIQTK